MKTIPLEKIGCITSGPETGKFILVRDDRKRTGGFLIFQSSASDIFSAPEIFDFWIEKFEGLDSFFLESGWNVEWKTRTYL